MLTAAKDGVGAVLASASVILTLASPNVGRFVERRRKHAAVDEREKKPRGDKSRVKTKIEINATLKPVQESLHYSPSSVLRHVRGKIRRKMNASS